MSTLTPELTNEQYHATPFIGASMLEVFRKSRRRYYEQYVARTIPAKPASPAMELGTLIHCRILEPEKFAGMVGEVAPEVAPDGKPWLRRKGSQHEAWWNEWLESQAGRIPVDKATANRIEAIAAAVWANEDAKRLLSRPGKPEYSISWKDRETGLELKCRVDYFAEIPVDLKTTKDPSPMAYPHDVVRFGYHRKRAHYQAGIFALTGEHYPFCHIAAGTEQPHEVAVYDIDDMRNGKSLGEQQWRETLNQLAECYASGDWSNPWESQITSLSIPNWAFFEDAYLVDGE